MGQIKEGRQTGEEGGATSNLCSLAPLGLRENPDKAKDASPSEKQEMRVPMARHDKLLLSLNFLFGFTLPRSV